MFKVIMIFLLTICITYYKFKDEIFLNTLVFGVSLPKTGIMKAWGNSVYYGADAYFQHVNESKKILTERKIKLIALDDKYEPELTIENINKLKNEKNIFAFFGLVGTPTVKNVLPIIENSDIPLIAPFTGASFLRTDNSKIINFRSSYEEEIDKIVGYLNDKKGISKFSVFFQNDDYGEEGYVALIKSLEKRDLELHGEGMYKRNTLSIRQAFSEIRNSQPEAIIMIGAYKANALFIKKAKNDEKLKDLIFCNISFGDANEMVKELDYDTKNIIFSEVVPSYMDFSMDVVREYRYYMKRYYPQEPLGFISLESFLAAKTIVAALSNVDGMLTHDKFIDELKNLPKNTLKGINLEYKNSQLLNKTYLFKYENSEFQEIKYEN